MGVKYIWWGHAKNMIAVYPIRKAQYQDMLDMKAPSLDGLPKGTGISNPVETLLISAEEKDAYNDYWAVKKALDLFTSKHGRYFMDFVTKYYWTTPRHRLEQIADELHMAPTTIFRWNRNLIRAVGTNRGWR